MGLLWTAIKWKIPFLGKIFGSSRLMLKFHKDNSVQVLGYKPNKERAINWKSQTGETKTHIRRNWHYLKDNGYPVDVVLEGKSENLNLVEEYRSTQEDSDTAGLCLSYLQVGEMLERRKHTGLNKEKLVLLMVILSLGASIFAVVNSYQLSQNVIPNIEAGLSAKIDQVGNMIKDNPEIMATPTPSASGIVRPEGSE